MPIYCMHDGKEHPDVAQFCMACGRPLGRGVLPSNRATFRRRGLGLFHSRVVTREDMVGSGGPPIVAGTLALILALAVVAFVRVGGIQGVTATAAQLRLPWLPPADAAAYRQQLQQANVEYLAANDGFGRFVGDLMANPSLASDDAWKNRLARALVALRATADRRAALGPVPTEYAAVAELNHRIANETRLFVADFAASVEGDAARQATAAERSARIADWTRQMQAELQRVSGT